MTAPRILIVEDERIIALHLRQQLTQLGYDVPNTVSSGDHALRRVEEAQPDLVLMDINLKGKLDGIATAVAIRRSYAIPIIYLTAYCTDETLARAAATHPDGYLLKPFSERELHAMIQVTLARRRTERETQAAQGRLQQARKLAALRRLAGGVADEVDDLLTVLYGQLEVLGGHLVAEPLLAEPIRDAFSEAIEKERLIRRLFEFSGRRKLVPATISLQHLMARISGRLRQIMGGDIPIRMLMADDLWQARIDPDQLGHALANLIANAREAMQGGGSLTIEAQNSVIDQNSLDSGAGAGHYVLLSVTDTGTGMPEDVVERAFEPFFTTRASGGASGLGLSLVFGFIQQSGGHISIDSKPGNGTTVRIYLPAATSDGLAIAAPGEQPCAAQSEQTGVSAAGIASDIVLDRVAAVGGQFGDDRLDPFAPAAAEQYTTSAVLWQRAENAVFASVPGPPGQARYRLVVEPLPRQNGWDWEVWLPGSDGHRSRYGRASSVVSAMAAAEDAAGHWASGTPDDRSDAADEGQ
jgi:signal transduction histidine kinase